MALRRERTTEPKLRDKARKHPRRTAVLIVLVLLAACGIFFGAQQLRAFQHWREAGAALEDGNSEKALLELDRCLDAWPHDAQVHLRLARAHRLAGNRTKAAEQLQACKESGGDASAIALEMQLLDASTGKLTAVEGHLRELLRANHPDKHFIQDALIRGYLIRQRNDEAEQLATNWIDESPQNWQPWLLRAIARSQLSRQLLSTAFDQAKADLQRVLELQPDHEHARFLLGDAYVQTGQFREALPHLEQYCRQKPDDAQGIVELVGCLRSLGRIDDALRTLDDWLATRAGTLEVFLLRGQVAMDLGRPPEALDFYRRAEALAPADDKTHYLLSLALRAVGRTDEAATYEAKWREHRELSERLKALEQVATDQPSNVAARYEAGTIALRLGEETAGLQWLGSALKLDPNHRPTHEALAVHFERTGNLRAAAAHRRQAGGKAP